MEPNRPAGRLMSLEEYLVFEERSPTKHEYVAGEVHAMTGVTTRHNLMTLNFVKHLHAAARSRGCKVFATDVKLQTGDRIYYPDVILASGRAAEVELIIEEPSLVVEVASASTRATDRREKLERYRQIPSLRMYLIVEQRRRHVLAYGRPPGWRLAAGRIRRPGRDRHSGPRDRHQLGCDLRGCGAAPARGRSGRLGPRG